MSGLASRVQEWIADLGSPSQAGSSITGPGTAPSESEVSTRDALSLPSAVSSGRQSTLATWLMTKNEGDPVRVRIGHVRGPNEFWIIPLPPISGADGATESIDPKCRLSRVLKTEEKLDELYGTSAKSSEATSSDTTTNNQGKITNSELKRGMMVAARLMTTGHWHRARVVEICYRSGITFVRVFLLDYGEYSYEIPLSAGIRKMPAKLMMTRPLAFLLVLRGLKPVSYDLNFMEGDKTFEEIATNRWTEAADKFVRDICHGKKEGILSNYTFDAGKKCQGVLEVDGYRDEGLVSVNRALINAKHARVVPEHPGGSKQLNLTSCGVVPMPRNLSICGSERDPGTITIPESVDFTDENFQMEDYLPVPSADLSVATDVSESSSRYGDNHQLTQFKHFDGETGTKPNNYNKMSRSMRGRFMRSTPLNQTVDSRHESESDSVGAAPSSSGPNGSFGGNGGAVASSSSHYHSQSSTSEPVMTTSKLSNKAKLARALAEKMKQREALNASMASSINPPQANKSHSSIWDSFREEVNDESGCEDSDDDPLDDCGSSKSSVALDDDSRHKRRLARRHKKALLNNSKIQMLPAGVDTGKFLEQQLRRVTNYGVGPKRIADLLE